jgi:hypothetical protein
MDASQTALELFRQADAALMALDQEFRDFKKKHLVFFQGTISVACESAHVAPFVRAEWDALERRRYKLAERRSEALSAWSASRENSKGGHDDGPRLCSSRI